jgi:hypothetical protein
VADDDLAGPAAVRTFWRVGGAVVSCALAAGTIGLQAAGRQAQPMRSGLAIGDVSFDLAPVTK